MRIQKPIQSPTNNTQVKLKDELNYHNPSINQSIRFIHSSDAEAAARRSIAF